MGYLEVEDTMEQTFGTGGVEGEEMFQGPKPFSR
jgi:hypothetical protein